MREADDFLHEVADGEHAVHLVETAPWYERSDGSTFGELYVISDDRVEPLKQQLLDRGYDDDLEFLDTIGFADDELEEQGSAE